MAYNKVVIDSTPKSQLSWPDSADASRGWQNDMVSVTSATANELGELKERVERLEMRELSKKEAEKRLAAWGPWKWLMFRTVALLAWGQGACYRLAGDAAWRSADGRWQLISALDDEHLANIIKRVYRSQPTKKSHIVHVLEREYNKRKHMPDLSALKHEAMNALQADQLDASTVFPLGFVDAIRSWFDRMAIVLWLIAVAAFVVGFFRWLITPHDGRAVCQEWAETMQYENFKVQADDKVYQSYSSCTVSYREGEKVKRLVVHCDAGTCKIDAYIK